MTRLPLLLSLCITLITPTRAADANYDEAKVPRFFLPNPLIMQDGSPVTTPEQWRTQRRPEILGLFSSHVYGQTPPIPTRLTFEILSQDNKALNGLANRKEVRVYLLGDNQPPYFDLLLYTPAKTKGPVPAFLGLNFGGNHTIQPDPNIRISQRWMRNQSEKGVENNHATEASRGTAASRWPVDLIVQQGFGVATIYCGDFEPDHADGWKDGIRAHFSPDGANTNWKPSDWGCIGAWAWGLSRALDYLEQDPSVDAGHVAVLGHSRLGKTSLWAGAQDERFAIVISNNSGEGGAALARRCFGETTAIINRAFPHWFCNQFKTYADQEDQIPVDQHQLLALVAPRPLYVASAEQDQWADPKGEYLAAYHASDVYQLLGLPGLSSAEIPPPSQSVGQYVGYHLRPGKHDITRYDWEQYLLFAKRHWKL